MLQPGINFAVKPPLFIPESLDQFTSRAAKTSGLWKHKLDNHPLCGHYSRASDFRTDVSESWKLCQIANENTVITCEGNAVFAWSFACHAKPHGL